MSDKTLITAEKITDIINTISDDIYSSIEDLGQFAIVGVQTRGVELANRICKRIEELSGKKIQLGILDITFHRDDLATRGVLPAIKETRIEFDITNKIILLVDDVLFTGRTTKAALETLTTFGRPKAIKLFTLIDRGNRELPIQPDYCGYTISTKIDDKVKVRLKEIDDMEDIVMISSSDT